MKKSKLNLLPRQSASYLDYNLQTRTETETETLPNMQNLNESQDVGAWPTGGWLPISCWQIAT